MPSELSTLDRRIVGVLQSEGRASWSTVAQVLDEPLRTVTRRGRDLLESGTVRVIGLQNLGPTCVIEIGCEPSQLARVARGLVAHPGVVFVLVLSNPTSLLVEVHERAFDLATMTLEQIPELAGVTAVSATPVLKYFATQASWRPGLLSAAEEERLGAAAPPDELLTPPVIDSDADRAIVDALAVDGRVALSELASAAGVTEPTARKKLRDLLDRDVLTIRALVDPASLGFPVAACVRVACAPALVDEIGEAIGSLPESLYVAHVLGEQPLIAQLSARDLPHLRELLSAEWTRGASAVHASLVPRVYKRSGRSALTGVSGLKQNI